MKKAYLGLLVGFLIITCAGYGTILAVKQRKKRVIVGVFDSRAVACAWLRSEEFKKQISQMRSSFEKAKVDGNEKLMKEFEENGPKIQERAHKQVFGNEPIDNILERIQKKLPKISANAGADILISKWEIAYQNKSAKFVDVTWEMVYLFRPDEVTVKLIKEILGQEPVSSQDDQPEQMLKKISRRELNKIFKKYSITSQKGEAFDKKIEQISIICNIEVPLKPVFAHSFKHSLVSALQSNGISASIESDSMTGFKKKGHASPTYETMLIDIKSIYRERPDGVQAIVGTSFEVKLMARAKGDTIWQATGKVNYIRDHYFGPSYTAHEAIRKEFAFSTSKAIVSAFTAEVNNQMPTRIFVVIEDREKHKNRVD